MLLNIMNDTDQKLLTFLYYSSVLETERRALKQK